MTGDQVAARARPLQCVFGSELWRRDIVAEDATARAVSAVPTYGVPDGWLQRTALCARKILAFLKVGIGSTPVPIYQCAAADAQAVGRRSSHTVAGTPLSGPVRNPRPSGLRYGTMWDSVRRHATEAGAWHKGRPVHAFLGDQRCAREAS